MEEKQVDIQNKYLLMDYFNEYMKILKKYQYHNLNIFLN